MIELKNQISTVLISEMGAELHSFVSGGREYIWQRNPDIWNNSSPILFPVCGSLRDDEIIINGKNYSLPKHGFAKISLFEVEYADDTSVTFLLKSSAETKEVYPYDFEFRVIYTLIGKRLSVRNEVTNLTDGDMYFSVGFHEGYATPEGIDEYDVVFPTKETLYSYNLEGPLLDGTKTLFLEDSDTIHLSYEYYDGVDTLIFKDIVSRSAVLKKRDGSRAIRVEFDGFESFMLWTKIGAPYICMEPWNGTPDLVDADKKIENKLGIQKVSAGQTYVRTHSLEIIK